MAREALNEPAQIPRELDRWNWGAFLLNWIWGIGNSTFIALLMFVPLVNIVMIFVLGARGSAWAWDNRYWRDAEHFRRTQRKWAIAGFIVWAALIALFATLFYGITTGLKSSEPYRLTLEAVRANEAATEALGAPLEEGFMPSGGISIGADGSGRAALSIAISGSKASGRAVSQAERVNGEWDLRLVFVTIEGNDVPIVIVNKDNVRVPNASIGI